MLVSSACFFLPGLAAYFKISFPCCLGLSAVKVLTETVHKAGCYCCYYYFYYCFSGFLNWHAFFRAAKAADLQGKAQKQGWNNFPSLVELVFISSHHLIVIASPLSSSIRKRHSCPTNSLCLKASVLQVRWCWLLDCSCLFKLGSFDSLLSGYCEKPLGSQLQYSSSVALAHVFS